MDSPLRFKHIHCGFAWPFLNTVSNSANLCIS